MVSELVTGAMEKVRLLMVQVPEVGVQVVELREVKLLGAVMVSAVALAGKEAPRAKGVLRVRVMFEF